MRPLNILQLIHLSDIGGAERMVLSLVKSLDRRRFRAGVACLRGGGKLADELQQAEVPFYELNLRRPAAWFRRWLAEKNIDLLQTHGARAEFFGTAAARLAGVRVVVSTLHDLYSFDHRGKRLTNRLVDPFIDCYVSVTRIGRRLAEERFHIDARRVQVIENGIEMPAAADPARLLALRRELGVDDGLLIVTVANLRPVKGHIHILRAVQSMDVATRRRLTFCFVGADQMNGELQRAAIELGVAEQVKFTGFRKDVTVLLQAADLFLLPSESEGLPMALLEAMAAGCPAVATNVGGVSEVIEHGRTGMLIPAASPPAIKEALKMLLDGSLRRSMAAQAQRIARSRFSVERMARRYEDLFERLVRLKLDKSNGTKA